MAWKTLEIAQLPGVTHKCCQGVHLDSWILLAKLHYALGNYTDSLKYYEKAQVTIGKYLTFIALFNGIEEK